MPKTSCSRTLKARSSPKPRWWRVGQWSPQNISWSHGICEVGYAHTGASLLGSLEIIGGAHLRGRCTAVRTCQQEPESERTGHGQETVEEPGGGDGHKPNHAFGTSSRYCINGRRNGEAPGGAEEVRGGGVGTPQEALGGLYRIQLQRACMASSGRCGLGCPH